jgi:uncharacterized integral membrane protein
MIFLILSLLIIALVVVFAVQNTALTTVHFFVWTFQGSLALILLIALSAGVLISLLVSLPTMVNNRLTLRSHKKNWWNWRPTFPIIRGSWKKQSEN